ncbi:unnamed protein product, partial [Rotaria magnacalcarata]
MIYCASVKTVNDSQIDCIDSSDERDFCRRQYPFDFTQRYKLIAYHDRGKFISIIYHCDGLGHCNNHEDEWLCDIIDQSEARIFTSRNLLDFIPILPKNTKDEPPQNVTLSWYCNRGIPVNSTVRENEIKCFCPPVYYGDRCEYQRKRLNVILELQVTTLIVHTRVFILLIFLVQISTDYVTYSAELIYLHFVQCLP